MKVALIDDHELILESLGMLLESLEGIDEIRKFEDPNLALKACIEEDFDVIITDYDMPEMNGCAFTLKIRKVKPNARILMLTVSENVQTIREGFQAGILGYVMKKASKKELKEAINTVAAGKRYISEFVLFELLNPQGSYQNVHKEHTSIQPLTSREIEIVEQIGMELSTKEIAEKLFVSVATVEKHRHNILKKLEVKNSIGILKYAMQNNLIA